MQNLVTNYVGLKTDKNTRKIKFVRRKKQKMKKIRIDVLLNFDDEGYENGEFTALGEGENNF